MRLTEPESGNIHAGDDKANRPSILSAFFLSMLAQRPLFIGLERVRDNNVCWRLPTVCSCNIYSAEKQPRTPDASSSVYLDRLLSNELVVSTEGSYFCYVFKTSFLR